MTINALGARLARIATAVVLTGLPSSASAQVVETVGTRALGMGGAFVAVADDSSASWWNPAGFAAGPFVEIALSHASAEVGDRPPGREDRVSGIALGTPPFGFAYYRLEVTQTGVVDPTGPVAGDREHRLVETGVHSLSANQFGATVLRTVVPGVHAGATVKYLDGALDGGEGQGRVDLDIGALAVVGPVRVGGVARNLFEPEFESADGATARLPRQVRLGAAFDAGALGGPPLMVAVDVDAVSYATSLGDRRMVAVGAEHWLFGRRLGVRGGLRVNTTGVTGRTVAAGASVALRSGLFLDAHLSGGGSTSEQGWGASARVSF